MFRLIILSLFVLHSTCDESQEDIVFGESCGTTEWIQKGELDEYDTAECIEATEDSCVNSFQVDFVPGTVEANVYYQVFSDEANLKISILDENDSFITSYEYSKNKHIEGWSHISIPVEQHFRGYVKLQANSFSNDVILVDSIQFIANNTLVPQSEILKLSIQQKNTDEDLILRQFEFNDNDLELEPEYGNDFDYDSESVEDEDSASDYGTKLKNIDLEQNSQQIQEQKLDNEDDTDVLQAAEEELEPEVHELENAPVEELQPKISPEAELELVPELEPEPEIQPELQSNAEREPSLDLDLESDQQPESALQAEPELELEAEPAEELELEPDAEPKTELQLEPELNIQPELEPVPGPASEPILIELKPEPEAEPKLVTTPEPEPEPEPEVESKLKPKIEPEPEVGQEPEFEPELKPAPEGELDPELEFDPQAEPESELEAKPKGELEPELEPELEFEPQIQQELEPEPELESKPELEPIFGFRYGPEPKLERESDLLYNGSGFWNVWTISLVVLSLAVVVSITAVSAYHCGKLRRQESVLLIDEEEEPRNIIPRVKKAYHNPAYYV